MQLRPDRGPGKVESVEGKKTLFVGNLPGEVDEDSLSSLFAEVGFVSSAKVERTADGTSKGWGYSADFKQFYCHYCTHTRDLS